MVEFDGRDWETPGGGGVERRTSINCLAFIIAASCLTWFINWVFGSEEEERASIFAVFDAREDKGFVLFFVQ